MCDPNHQVILSFTKLDGERKEIPTCLVDASHIIDWLREEIDFSQPIHLLDPASGACWLRTLTGGWIEVEGVR